MDNIAKSVALQNIVRDTALGLTSSEIAQYRELDVDFVDKVKRGSLFRKKLKDMQEQMNQQLIEEQQGDPLRQKLRAHAGRAISRVVEEIDNTDPSQGASATTRLKAAATLLDRAGYGVKQDEAAGSSVTIMISTEKMDGIKKSLEALQNDVLESIPDCVDG